MCAIPLNTRLRESILFYDGAMGTMLQEQGVLLPGGIPEELNLSCPDAIEKVHRAYVNAGADIIETNTFGGHKPKLEQCGLGSKFKDINAAAVKIARACVSSDGYVAAGIGPFEKMVEPLGIVTFDESVAMYREWVEVVANAGADLILFETFSDIKELKAAIIAAKEVCDLPIQAQLTFAEGARTVTGTPADAAAVILSSLGVDIIGTNCSQGPKEMYEVGKILCAHTDHVIALLPNAGMPQLIDGKTVFLESPEQMASYAKKFVEAGVSIIGGCCGSTPAHIKAMKTAVVGMNPVTRAISKTFSISSRTQLFTYDKKKAPYVIGERINPTGKKAFQKELCEGKTTGARRFAVEQTKKGAHALDINVGAPGADERVMMKKVVRAVQTVSPLPLVIDSTDPIVVEEGLKEFAGKALINSVNGEEKSMRVILPLAKKYGAAIIILTTDEDGLAETAEKRYAIVEKVKEAAEKIGILKEDMLVDALALAISVGKEQAGHTVRAIRRIKEELGILTSLGVSNISFGLPHRHVINAHFFSLAAGFGLDFGIINPSSEEIMDVVREKKFCAPEEQEIERFVEESFALQFKDVPPPKKSTLPVTEENVETLLHEAILLGDKDTIEELLSIALHKGLTSLDINLNILIPAIKEVGSKFEAQEFFLPQLIMSAETMQCASGILMAQLPVGEEMAHKGTILMATVHGDMHDIGKNIVCAVLESYGYDVVDLGRNVSTDAIIARLATYEKDVVLGLSALMTTTMVEMERIVSRVREAYSHVKIMVGGAAVTRDYAAQIKADAYSKDAIEAVKVVESFFKTVQQ